MNLYKRSELIIQDLLDGIPEPPERNCSCHINPPCSDCVDHSWERDVHKEAKKLLKELKAAQLLLPD